ncbi:MAG TPA: hypothetical protein PK098_06410 [Phycisphaerales bacterium]|nr:hypothetical protein [Phycisphaerales bacterium]
MVMNLTRLRPIVASFSVVLVSTAWAGAPTDDKSAPKAPERPLLSGPTIGDDEGRPMRRTRQGEMQAPRAGQAQDNIPHRMWLRLYQSQNLDDAQREAAMLRLQQFQADMMKFQEEHGESLRELRIKMRDARENPEALGELRAAMQKIESNLPKPEPVQRDLWRILRPEQQQAMQARLTEIREEMAKRRQAEVQARDQAGEQRRPLRGGSDAAPPQRRPNAEGAPRPGRAQEGAPPRRPNAEGAPRPGRAPEGAPRRPAPTENDAPQRAPRRNPPRADI